MGDAVKRIKRIKKEHSGCDDNCIFHLLISQLAKAREASKIVELIRTLANKAEGNSVRIYNDNPHPSLGSSNSCIEVFNDFKNIGTLLYGESLLDCLKKALTKLKEPSDE